ncbi:MAG: RluA family pseudouridine synthase [Firmicutes bacterium]|nr:RluA family pseudouridine synthase [Bacillota bacterium]
MFEYTVKTEYYDLVLQDFLELFRLSKKKFNQLTTSGKILVNGAIVALSYNLKTQDLIHIDFLEEEGIDYPIALESPKVCYEDDFILAVSKPENMICYDVEKRNIQTLASLVANHYNKTSQNLKIRHLHRIDRDTTGLVLYAKNILSHSYYSTLWDTETIERKYLAIVEGKMEKSSGTINLPIGSDRHNNNRYVVSHSGKPAITKFKVLIQMKDSALIECSLETGRTHQIRVHLSHMGHPLIGDTVYGSKSKTYRTLLHSHSIYVYHPLKCEYITITDNLPKDMQNYLLERGIYEY